MKQLVVVVWDDTEDGPGTWMDEKEVNDFSDQTCMVESVGYLVSKGAKYVTIAGDWVGGLKHWGRVTKIPTGMVESITTLREASE